MFTIVKNTEVFTDIVDFTNFGNLDEFVRGYSIEVKDNDKEVLLKENLTEEDKVLIYTEIEVMKVLDNMQNIIHLHSTYETSESYYIVMEYCQGSSLLFSRPRCHSSRDETVWHRSCRAALPR